MTKLLIDYTLDKVSVANPNGSFGTTFTGCTVTNGPGQTSIGNFPAALNLGTTGKAVCNLSGLVPDLKRFCIQVVFNASGEVKARQNLAECTSLPFALFLDKGKTATTFELVTTVMTKNHGWRGPDTLFKKTLQTNKWYTATLAYDLDTAALFIDNDLISVHAFPNGTIEKLSGNNLYLGTWTDGARNHFNGLLAAFRLYSGIPAELESKLDEKRSQSEWAITYKTEELRKTYAVGERSGKTEYNLTTGAFTQFYSNCAVMYHHTLGTALEMHGAIFQAYNAYTKKNDLGYLVSDEINTTKAGGKKNLFSQGAIYWSGTTGAIPVLDKIYLEYEFTGESKTWGFPTKVQKVISGGLEQEFQGCRMYYKNGAPNAREVHGDILSSFLSSGGIGQWGFPVSNENDIKRGNTIIGKCSEFESCIFYWSSGTGAFEVHGDILRKYKDLNGPLGELGFPTSNEINIPSYSGTGRMNTFKNGSILWYGSYSGIQVALPFQIWIGRLHSKENEGFLMGQNDMYIKKLQVLDGNTSLHSERRPSSGSWSDKNVVNVNYLIPVTIVPNAASKKITLSLDIWDDDSPTADDHLGQYTKVLNAANAWGLAENSGIYNVSFDKIISLTWSVKPKVDISSLSEPQKWWAMANRSTPNLTRAQYASAFRDVDSETEWWDITDGLQNIFYDAIVKKIADGGNCFGMSLEGVYARKNRSLFGMPLNNYQDWELVRNEINIKHAYQVGAEPIWWFLGQFVSGNTHDPKDVFIKTRRAFNANNNPLLCIAQNADFSGAPHCIMPVKWDDSSKPWRISICDPNFPGQLKELTIDPDNNTFRYMGSKTYSGGAWSGGRLHYMPYSILDKRPRTPLWEALLLLLAGTLIILADDAETVAINDAAGNDLDAFGERAAAMLRNGVQPSEFFVKYNGVQTGIKRGNLLIRSEKSATDQVTSATAALINQPIHFSAGSMIMVPLQNTGNLNNNVKAVLDGRTAFHVLNDPDTLQVLPPKITTELQKISAGNDRRNFVHQVKGSRNGQLEYIVKTGLSSIKVKTPLNNGEKHQIEIRNLGTQHCTVKMDSARVKNASIEMHNQLSVKGDFVHIRVDNLPLSASAGMELNLKPGLGGIEIKNMGAQTNVTVNIHARQGKTEIQKSFVVSLDKGVRIKPASFLAEKVLTVSNIDRLFGKPLETKQIK